MSPEKLAYAVISADLMSVVDIAINPKIVVLDLPAKMPTDVVLDEFRKELNVNLQPTSISSKQSSVVIAKFSSDFYLMPQDKLGKIHRTQWVCLESDHDLSRYPATLTQVKLFIHARIVPPSISDYILTRSNYDIHVYDVSARLDDRSVYDIIKTSIETTKEPIIVSDCLIHDGQTNVRLEVNSIIPKNGKQYNRLVAYSDVDNATILVDCRMPHTTSYSYQSDGRNILGFQLLGLQ
tara:strand:- start:667 stop:1377 length:711 start_codon:yes stop_codon:yes gene_type:complete